MSDPRSESRDPERPHIGWVGDAWSGTLTCNFPDCGWEQFTNAFDAEDVADAHWAEHIGSTAGGNDG